MRPAAFIIVFIFSVNSCKTHIDIIDVMSNLTVSEKTVPADGQSTVDVQVQLTDKSSTDRRNIIFKTSSGKFAESDSSSFISKAKYDNGKLIAKATLKAPFKPGEIKIESQPEFDSPIKEFILSESITAIESPPSSIILEASSLGIKANYASEIQLNGLIKNSSDKFVSDNNSVLFEDILLSGAPANGRFRAVNNKTSGDSKVSAIYSASSYLEGTTIELRVTVLDKTNQKTSIKNSVFVNIN